MSKATALVRTWLLIDFFGDARRAGRGHASSLTSTIFTQSFLAFVFAALLYPDTPPVPFAAANLCLSSLLVAIGALGDEGRPERRAADELLLRTSPLSRLTAVLARAGHSAFALLLVTVGMALPPAILLAFVTGDALRGLGYLVAACLCSGIATGTLGVVAGACTRWLGPARTALMLGSTKAMLLGGGVVLFALSLPRLRATAQALPIGRAGAEWLPPYHLARWLAQPIDETWRLASMFAVGAVLLLLGTWLGSAAGGLRAHRIRGGIATRLLLRITPPGPSRALAEFTAIGMWRSAGFRARVLPLLGIPAAMVFLSLRSGTADSDFVLLCILAQLPAIYLPFLVLFLPRADQPGAAWVFAQAPGVPREVVCDAAWRALVTHVLLPVFAATGALSLARGTSGLAALAATVWAFACAVFAARSATADLPCVPFTEARDAQGGPELGGLFARAIALGGLGAAFGALLPSWLRWPVAVAAVAAAALQLRAHPTPKQPPAAAVLDEHDAPEATARTQDPTTMTTKATPPPATLRRELHAILVLYGVLGVLPLLVGTIFAA